VVGPDERNEPGMRIRLFAISTRTTRRLMHTVHESLLANTMQTTWRRSAHAPHLAALAPGRRPIARYGDQTA
jgi:hypothetical protein